MNKSSSQMLLTVLCILSLSTAYGQALSTAEHQQIIDSLDEKGKVDYIIKNFYALYSADFDHAVKVTKMGADLAAKNKWKDKEAYCLMDHAVIQGLRGNFQNSLAPFLRAYDLFDSLHHYDGLAHLHNEMAVFYNRQFDRKTCDSLLEKAKVFALKAGNNEALGTTYGHQATLLERDGKIKEASTLYLEVYRIRLAQKDSVGLGYVLLDLSNMALREKDLDGALRYIDESTVIREKTGDKQGVAANLVSKGEAYFAMKNYPLAIQYMEQGLERAKAIRYIDLVRYTYDQLSNVHAATGNYKLAFVNQQQTRAFNDSLYNVEKAKAIADTQTKYETQKKEQEIALQRAQLAEQRSQLQLTYIAIVSLLVIVALGIVIFLLARSRHRREQQLLLKEKEIATREAYINATIQSQEEERKRFARDLHDGMGQLISALRLAIQPIVPDTRVEERVAMADKAEKIIGDMQREVRGIAFNLMPQTLIQYGLVPALKEMADRMNHSGRITIRVTSFDVPERLREIQEISIYRVVQEWTNNVVKYSDATLIEIQLVGHQDELAITVEDNGRGFDIEVLRLSNGNGWKNIMSRLGLVKGMYDVDSSPERNGTTFNITIPMKTEAAVTVAG